MWFVRDSQYCRLQCMSLEYVEFSEECLFGWLKDVKNLTWDGMLPIASFDEMHRYSFAGKILRYKLGVKFSGAGEARADRHAPSSLAVMGTWKWVRRVDLLPTSSLAVMQPQLLVTKSRSRSLPIRCNK